VFQIGAPGEALYGDLIRRAFCWSSTYPGCDQSGTPRGARRRFALHNGRDTIALTFRHSSFAHPPALRLRGDAGCAARRLDVTGENRSGQLRLVLRCRWLKRGAAVWVRFVQPIRRSFSLHRGNGSIRVRLAKPLGTVEPLVYVSYGRANKSCTNVTDRLRLRSRTLDLRVNARCGRAGGNALAYLYIGGLLQ
jgi:hypothetical protein